MLQPVSIILMMKRKVIIYIASVALFFAVILLALFIGRNALLNSWIQRKVKEAEQEKELIIHYGDLRLNGFSEVEMNNLTVVPLGCDTLIDVAHVAVKFDLWELLKLNIDVARLRGEKAYVTFVKQGDCSNYEFLFRKQAEQATPPERDYGKRVNRLLGLLFSVLPERAEVKDMLVSWKRDSTLIAVRTPDFTVADHRFSTSLEMYTEKEHHWWQVRGELYPSRRTLQAELTATGGGNVHVPGLKCWNTDVSFHTLSFSLTEDRSGGTTELTGSARVAGLEVVNAALSPVPVRLNQASLTYEAEIGKDYFELMEGSTVQFNELDFQPAVRARKKSEKWHFTVAVDKPFFPARQLFSSLPPGLFGTLDGLQADGELAYHFLLDVDFDNLDALRLESEMQEKGFRITNFGNGELTKLNAPFLYTAYDNGVPVRTFEVGSGNPGYVPLDSIPLLLRTAVMQSEDGSFFSHRGFRMDALRSALIHDLKVKRFARGGSTISMQLVKNVFLNRNKNLLRKLEEAMVTWLIESQGLASKHRMYEVYLNICEWGPRIYGIREASHFYFAKEPSQLTPEEAIFLASIVPKPKHFRSQFTPEGELRPWLAGYFRTIARLLARSGVITEEQAAAMQPSVRLTGPAAQDFSTLPADSLELDDQELLLESSESGNLPSFPEGKNTGKEKQTDLYKSSN